MKKEIPFMSFVEYSAKMERERKASSENVKIAGFSSLLQHQEREEEHLDAFHDAEFMRHFKSILNFGLTQEEKEFMRKGNVLDSLDGLTILSNKNEEDSVVDIEDIATDCELFGQCNFDVGFDNEKLHTVSEDLSDVLFYGDDVVGMGFDDASSSDHDNSDDGVWTCNDDPVKLFFNARTLRRLEPSLIQKRESGLSQIISKYCSVRIDSNSFERFERWSNFNLFMGDEVVVEIDKGRQLFHTYYDYYVRPCLDVGSSCSIAMMLHPINLLAYMLKIGVAFELGSSYWKSKIRKMFFYMLGLLSNGDDGEFDVSHFLNITQFGVIEGYSKCYGGDDYFSLLAEVCNVVAESNCGIQWEDGKLFVYNEFGDTAFGMWYVFSSEFDPTRLGRGHSNPPRIGLPVLKAMKSCIEKQKLRSLNSSVNPWSSNYTYHGPLHSYAEPLLLTGDGPVYDFIADVSSDPGTMVLTVINQSIEMVNRWKRLGYLPLKLKWRAELDQEYEHHLITIDDVGIDYTLYVIKSSDIDHLIVVRWAEFPGDDAIVQALSQNSTVAVYCRGRLVMDRRNKEDPLVIRVPIEYVDNFQGPDTFEAEPGGNH